MPDWWQYRAALLLPWPTRVVEKAGLLFCERLFNDLGPHLRIDVHLLQASVLVFQLPHLGQQRHVHAAEPGALLVKRGRADAVFTAQIRHRRTGLSPLSHCHDLAVGKSRSLHCRTSSFHFEKILPLKTVLLREGLPPWVMVGRLKSCVDATSLLAPSPHFAARCSMRPCHFLLPACRMNGWGCMLQRRAR